jgi:RNA polymerase sigma-70 factor (ECF subfamily)
VNGFAERWTGTAIPKPAEHAEMNAAIEHAISLLPARRREVFLLRMMDDLSYEEIAAVMGTSRQTVANQLSRALATLRPALAHLLD